METKYVRVPFEVELAKRIQNKECEGRIVTRDGRSARVVCWDLKAINKSYCILALIDNVKDEVTWTYSNKGCSNTELESKHDLMLEIPEYMTFKDGDVIAFGGKRVYIGIYKCANKSNGAYSDYVVLNDIGALIFDKDCWIHNDSRFATEEERQKLIDALKESKDPKAKECLKKLGIEVKQECEFKPFDKVLVRDSDDEKWGINLFERYDGEVIYSYMCLDECFKQCIPYNEETAHLLGTTDNP